MKITIEIKEGSEAEFMEALQYGIRAPFTMDEEQLKNWLTDLINQAYKKGMIQKATKTMEVNYTKDVFTIK